MSENCMLKFIKIYVFYQMKYQHQKIHQF